MDRGMKKWMPFKSLVEYDDYLNESLINRNKVEKPILSEDQEDEIDENLHKLVYGDTVDYSYFEDGFIYKKRGTYVKADLKIKCAYIDNLAISFDNLLYLRQD